MGSDADRMQAQTREEQMNTRGHMSWTVLAVATALGTVSVGASAQEKTLPIGVLGPLSGSAAPYGAELVRSAEMRADEINKAGGLKVGSDVYRLKVIAYDHKAIAAEAATATNKLVFQDKVRFIIGNAIGATCNAAQTITEPQKVLFGFVCWGTANLGPEKPYSFRTVHSPSEVVEPFYRWIKETRPAIKKIAAISPNDTSGTDTLKVLAKVAKGFGFEVVSEETYERGTKDFYPILTKMLATKPDIIELAASLAAEAAQIVKQARELGFKGAKGWIAGQNVPLFLEMAGKDVAEGVWSPSGVNVKSQLVNPAVRKFAEEYEKRYKELPAVVAIGNYGAFDVFTRAMQQAGSVEPEKVLAAITKGSYDTVWGTLIIGGMETYGINRQFLYPVVISEIRNGEVVDVAAVPPAASKK